MTHNHDYAANSPTIYYSYSDSLLNEVIKEHV